jgi:hypothetical protein
LADRKKAGKVKRKGPPSHRKTPTQKLRDEITGLRESLRGAQATQSKLQDILDAHIEKVSSLSEELDETRTDRDFYQERFNTARRDLANGHRALELVFAVIAPGAAPEDLLDSFESMGKQLLDGRMDEVRPVLKATMAEGSRRGISLYWDRKVEKDKVHSGAVGKAAMLGLLAALADPGKPGERNPLLDILGSLSDTDLNDTDDSEHECKDPDKCPVHRKSGLKEFLKSMGLSP